MTAVMRALRAWWSRIAGFVRPGAGERDFADELQSHIDLHTDDNIRAGMTPDEARRQALVRIGSVARAREAHDRRGLPGLDGLVFDLKLGGRMLVKYPGLTIVGGLAPTRSFISTVDTFQMGEVLTFVSESRPEGRDVTSYVFADAAGALRTFDVPDDMPPMALYQRFRAVDMRDGGCPDCREQRDRGQAACLEQVGHGAGPTIYYQCRRCMALWEENTREIHVVLDRLLTCPHLEAVERELRSSGVRIELETKDWDDREAGFRVYFRARIDPVATRAQFELPEFVEYHEWDGRVGGAEAGFRCARCYSAVLGVHPAYSEGHPVFPTNMHVSPQPE